MREEDLNTDGKEHWCSNHKVPPFIKLIEWTNNEVGWPLLMSVMHIGCKAVER